MGGWVPFDAVGWPAVAEALAKPWPREAILFDLRWWADREAQGRGRRPGRPALARRYGWPDRQIRTLIANGEWEDPVRRPATVQRPSSDRPESTPKDDVAPTPTVQRPSSDRPATVPTRVGDHPHLSLSPRDDTPPPATVDLRNPGGLDPAAGYPAALWPELVRSCLEEAGVVPLGGKLSAQEAKAAAQIARDHPSREAIMRTLRWILDAKDPAATRARKQIDERRLRFVLSDWPEYDRAAQQDEQRPRAPPPKPRPTDDEVFGPLIPRRPPPRPE